MERKAWKQNYLRKEHSQRARQEKMKDYLGESTRNLRKIDNHTLTKDNSSDKRGVLNLEGGGELLFCNENFRFTQYREIELIHLHF